MDAEKSRLSEAYARLKQQLIPPVKTVIEDLDSVRVEPASPTAPTPPWQRHTSRKGDTKRSI